MKKIYSLMMICLLCMQLVLPVYAAQPETDSLDTMTQMAQEQKDTTTGSNGTETTKDADTKKNTENTDTADTIKPQTKEDTFSGEKDTTLSDKPGKADDSQPTEQAAEAALHIDNQNVYEGMTKPYQKGYQPVCENGKVNLVLPLVSDGKLKNNRLTAAVDLGATENSPFIFKTYEKDFTCKPETVNGTQETKEVFLVAFSLELNKKRTNGVYPIIVNVSATDESGQEVQKTFTNYVTIKDGSGTTDAGAGGDMGGGASGGGTGSETPTSNPIVLISKCVIEPDTVKAGDDFTATVTFENTNKKKSVQNMVATVNVPSADFELRNGTNTFFIGKIGKGKSVELALQFHASKSIADGNYAIEIAMSYDDAKATTCTSTGNIVVTVEQPLDVELTMPVIEKEMTAGDTVPFSFQVMNLSRSTVYNVRCDVNCNGLTQTKTAFVGNMESGTAGEGVTNIFVSMMDGENAYGDTKGVVTLTYEDSFGNAYTKEYDFETSIVKMPDNTEAIQSQEPKSASQWWISVAVVAGFLLLMGCTGAAYWLGRKKR